MYLFTQSTNILSTAYYQGFHLVINPSADFSQQKKFLASIVNLNNKTMVVNETLDIFITVYNFNNSQYFIDFSQLRYVF